MIKLKTKIEIKAIMKLLVIPAKIIASVISADDNGAYNISTMFPCILPIIIEDDVWENDCWITCIAISPGARNDINGNPKTSFLSFPIAKLRTNKKSKDVINGEKIVWIQTIKNLKTSFW